MKYLVALIGLWLVCLIIAPVHTLAVTAAISIIGGILLTSGDGDMGGGRW